MTFGADTVVSLKKFFQCLHDELAIPEAIDRLRLRSARRRMRWLRQFDTGFLRPDRRGQQRGKSSIIRGNSRHPRAEAEEIAVTRQ
jgi:hypothetical protein